MGVEGTVASPGKKAVRRAHCRVFSKTFPLREKALLSTRGPTLFRFFVTTRLPLFPEQFLNFSVTKTWRSCAITVGVIL